MLDLFLGVFDARLDFLPALLLGCWLGGQTQENRVIGFPKVERDCYSRNQGIGYAARRTAFQSSDFVHCLSVVL